MQKCLQCSSETSIGDVRSGAISFGAHFVEYQEGKKTVFGDPKPKAGLQRNNRVVSYACKSCGYISSYLESVINETQLKSSGG